MTKIFIGKYWLMILFVILPIVLEIWVQRNACHYGLILENKINVACRQLNRLYQDFTQSITQDFTNVCDGILWLFGLRPKVMIAI